MERTVKNNLGTSTDDKVAAAGEVFLTEYDLALRWKVSAKKLQADRWKEQGVPFVRIGRSVRYRLAEIIAYEENRTVYESVRRVKRSTYYEVR
jgi:hypothetical protein